MVFPVRSAGFSCYKIVSAARSRHDRGGENMALPMGRAAKVVTFVGLKCRATSFRVAGVALRDIPTRFIMCQKSFCVTGAIFSIALQGFQKMICILVVGTALWRPPCSFCMAGANCRQTWSIMSMSFCVAAALVKIRRVLQYFGHFRVCSCGVSSAECRFRSVECGV